MSVRLDQPARLEASFAAHLGPAVSSGVDVLQLEAAALEVIVKADVPDRAQLRATFTPGAGDRGADAVENDLPSDRVEIEATASRKKRKIVTYLPLDVGARSSEERPEPAVETELLSVRSDEVKDGANALPGRLSQASSELLKKERRTIGRSKEKKRVDVRDVHALVEEIDGEDDSQLAVSQIAQRGLSFICATGCRESDGGETEIVESLRHETSVPTLTQKPSALIADGSASFRRISSTTRCAHA